MFNQIKKELKKGFVLLTNKRGSHEGSLVQISVLSDTCGFDKKVKDFITNKIKNLK